MTIETAIMLKYEIRNCNYAKHMTIETAIMLKYENRNCNYAKI